MRDTIELRLRTFSMTTSDDGLREIQLNGKQLVFLFMAVTVVSVVIFLCGVLVGRGVQARPGTPVEASATAESDPTADAAPMAATEPLEPTKADNLGYSERLQTTGPAAETLSPRSDSPRTAARTAVAPATASPAAGGPSTTAAPRQQTTPSTAGAPAAAQAAEVAPLPPEPKGDGIAIQVAFVRGRSEAEALLKRLKSKTYSAYIVPSVAGQPAGFRVRVGKFKTRAEAEKVAAKLEQEEQFKPWITR
ncbi:MAG TPA: SPOR domain-containing protein [Vicinamibacterales bacterium]|nr:SPOR domain-containing protein [Vicinamibacterales bacterium]